MTDEAAANRKLYLAAVLYFCVCLVHERYMVLLPLFYFSLIFRLSRNWKLWAAPTVGFALIQLLQVCLYRHHLPSGDWRNRRSGYHFRELCAALCVKPDCLYLRNQCGAGALKWTELPGSAARG